MKTVVGGQWSVVSPSAEPALAPPAPSVTSRPGGARVPAGSVADHRPLATDDPNAEGRTQNAEHPDPSALCVPRSAFPANPPDSQPVQTANERRSNKPTLYFSQCFCPACDAELRLDGKVAVAAARPPNSSAAEAAAARPTVGWSAARAELAALYAPPLAEKATWAKHRQVIVEWAGRVTSPAAIDAVAVAEWLGDLARRGLRPGTIKTLRATFAAQCRHFVEQGYLAASPFAAKKFRVRAGPKLDRHHPREDIVRVLDRADSEWKNAYDRFSAGRLRALVYLVAMTGLRAREALLLARADVDFVRGIVHVGRRGKVKTEKSRRRVGLPDECAAVLREWLDWLAPTDHRPPTTDHCDWVFPQRRHRDKPWTGGGTKTRPLGHVQALGRRAGIANLSLLNLRHTWATAGESLWQFSDTLIQRQMGHSNTTTQLGYRHSDVANLSAALRGISYRTGPALGIVDEQGNAKEAS